MHLDRAVQSTHPIYPLSFLQIYQSANALIAALNESDATVQEWVNKSPLLTGLMNYSAVPMYYHWFTSGYGAFVDQKIAGWMFLRGWHQVLYIEGLAVSSQWRRKGIGRELLAFAEFQARELRREWLGLTVTVNNHAAVALYESDGFERGHARILCRVQGGAALPTNNTISFRPVIAQTAGQVYQSFAERDLEAGDPETATVQSRFLGRERYRSVFGGHWSIRVGGRAVGYIHRHGTVIYIAAPQNYWASPEIVGALARVVSDIKDPQAKIELRLASDGHHDAMKVALAEYGYVEQPAVTMKMFKRLTK